MLSFWIQVLFFFVKSNQILYIFSIFFGHANFEKERFFVVDCLIQDSFDSTMIYSTVLKTRRISSTILL